jgi:TPR repeat protein
MNRFERRSLRLGIGALTCVLMLAFALLSPPAKAIVAVMKEVTPEDVARMKERALAGDKVAQQELGYWYRGGSYGLPSDLDESLKWFRKAAEQDDVTSQQELAAAYEFGEGIAPDHAEALRWISRALKTNEAASLLIVHRYRVGDHAPKDARKAIEWCRLSADAGDVNARNMLGELYEFGLQDFGEAARWYSKAANSDFAGTWHSPRAAAMMNLGRLYAAGNGLPLDYRQAANWFERAIEAGDIQAPLGLGLLYERGNGVPRDTKKAMELYYQSAANLAEARERLFLLYADVLPLPANQAAATHALFEAADAGDERAQLALGLRYKFGMGVPRDWAVAYALFNLAARAPNHDARLPDFTGPQAVAQLHMDTRAWKLVEEMQTRGQLRQAIARFQNSRLRSVP